ncbi:unnamed protein product, partial [Auanema sp. JU1783]
MKRLIAEEIEETLFTTSRPDAKIHTPVIAISDKYAVSHYNGPHSVLEEGTEVTLYNVVDPTIEYKSTVQTISQACDIVVFELLDSHFASFPCYYGGMCSGGAYNQLGVDSFRNPTWNVGTISEFRFNCFIGTSSKKPEDSTRVGIFSEYGRLLGFSTSKNMPIAQR